MASLEEFWAETIASFVSTISSVDLSWPFFRSSSGLPHPLWFSKGGYLDSLRHEGSLSYPSSFGLKHQSSLHGIAMDVFPIFPLPSKVGLARPSMSRVDPPGRKTVPWIVKAYVPLMVKLLEALAWAVKVDDAARARASRKSEMRNFMLSPDSYLGLCECGNRNT